MTVGSEPRDLIGPTLNTVERRDRGSNSLFRREKISIPNAELTVFYDALSSDLANASLNALAAEISWRQGTVKLFGRKIASPRLSAWYGDRSYTYSRETWAPAPWTSQLLKIKNHAETLSGAHFNGVLLNLYRSGQDSMGWHSDNEFELGNLPTIASLSLGAERRFLLRSKKGLARSYAIPLPHNSLLIMAGKTQENWQHSIPKTTKSVGVRINLTFRWTNN